MKMRPGSTRHLRDWYLSYTLPFGGSIEAEVGDKVVVDLQECIECDTSNRGRNTLVRLRKHGIKTTQGEVGRQEAVSQPVYMQ